MSRRLLWLSSLESVNIRKLRNYSMNIQKPDDNYSRGINGHGLWLHIHLAMNLR